MKDANLVDALLFQDSRINGYLEKCDNNNRLLWADVTKDGKTVYTGVFNHWIDRRNVAKDILLPTK